MFSSRGNHKRGRWVHTNVSFKSYQSLVAPDEPRGVGLRGRRSEIGVIFHPPEQKPFLAQATSQG